MTKNEIHSITINHKDKILKVQLKCCFMLVLTFDDAEKREEFQCEDFWVMIDKLCKKHKLAQYAPCPSFEESFGLQDILEKFFKVNEV